MKKTSLAERRRYQKQYISGEWISKKPQLLGWLPTSLVTAFHALPDANYGYRMLNPTLLDSEQAVVVEGVRSAFSRITNVPSYRCDTRFGWWEGTRDDFHVDGQRTDPLAVAIVTLGEGTEYAVGSCKNQPGSRMRTKFTVEDGTPVYSLPEGGVYRFAPDVIHREPPCSEPQNRLFIRSTY